MRASRLQLTAGPWTTLLDGLCARFPHIDRAQWRDRLARGRVLDMHGRPLAVDAPYRVGMQLQYFREMANEPQVAGELRIVHRDAQLLVVDKPHGLPVTPSGPYVNETVLGRLQRQLQLPELAPLHRLDRDTAGLVMLSLRPGNRAAYANLFRKRLIDKHYLALAAPLSLPALPFERRSRLMRGEPFFRMTECEGAANSQTVIEGIEPIAADLALYRLRPVSGRKHQLRVHMAALGAPIIGDRLYPDLHPQPAGPNDPPLQLLAHTLNFIDPLSGKARRFQSGRSLQRLAQRFSRLAHP